MSCIRPSEPPPTDTPSPSPTGTQAAVFTSTGAPGAAGLSATVWQVISGVFLATTLLLLLGVLCASIYCLVRYRRQVSKGAFLVAAASTESGPSLPGNMPTYEMESMSTSSKDVGEATENSQALYGHQQLSADAKLHRGRGSGSDSVPPSARNLTGSPATKAASSPSGDSGHFSHSDIGIRHSDIGVRQPYATDGAQSRAVHTLHGSMGDHLSPIPETLQSDTEIGDEADSIFQTGQCSLDPSHAGGIWF